MTRAGFIFVPTSASAELAFEVATMTDELRTALLSRLVTKLSDDHDGRVLLWDTIAATYGGES